MRSSSLATPVFRTSIHEMRRLDGRSDAPLIGRALATAAARKISCFITVEEAYEQGTTWIFRFSYSGYSEELKLSRSELVRVDWHVEVPASFEAALRDRGVSPPP